MPDSFKSKALTIIKWLWITGILITAAVYFTRNFRTVESYFTRISPVRLALSLGLMLVAKSLFALLSLFSVNEEKWDPPYRQMFSIYSLTQLAKYIPGGVWHYVGRFGIYRSREMSNTRAGKAMLLENIWLVSSALALGLFSIGSFDNNMATTLLNHSISKQNLQLAAVLILLLWIIVMAALPFFFSVSRKINLRRTGKTLLALTCAWVLVGTSFYVLFPAGSTASLPLAFGGFTVSWAAGFLAIFAPGGLGIRELLISFFFSSTLGASLASVLASVHRLVWVLSEIMLGIFFSLPISGIEPLLTSDSLDQDQNSQ